MGALRFVLLARIPFRGKVARTISARHALISEQIFGQKHVTAHYRQAKLYSRNLINIATETRLRQHDHPANRNKDLRNHPSKPSILTFVLTHRLCRETEPAGSEQGDLSCKMAKTRCGIGRGVEEIPARIYTEHSSILCAIKCFSRYKARTHAARFLPEWLSLLFYLSR